MYEFRKTHKCYMFRMCTKCMKTELGREEKVLNKNSFNISFSFCEFRMFVLTYIVNVSNFKDFNFYNLIFKSHWERARWGFVLNLSTSLII